MAKPSESLRDAIREQSRPLADIEAINACDIIWTENGYELIPNKMVGLRKSKIEIKDIRRWWGLLSKLRKDDYDRK